MVLPYIKMNLPQVYMCSPSRTVFPPPSPYHPSGSSQCTSPKHPVSCIKPGLATCFIYDIIHVSMPFFLIIPPSPSPTESKRLFYTSVSLLLAFNIFLGGSVKYISVIIVVQLLSRVQLFECLTLWPHRPQHAKLPCPSPSPRACSNHPPSIVTFSSCPQSFPASGSFPMSRLLASGIQSIGASASASVLPVNIQGWFPLGITGLISFLSKGLSRMFSDTTVQKHPIY